MHTLYVRVAIIMEMQHKIIFDLLGGNSFSLF